MVVQAYYDVAERVHFLIGVAFMAIIGIALLALGASKSKLAEA
jgi:hypothetical protein